MTIETIWNNSVPEPNTGCWLWLKSITRRGYGRLLVPSMKQRSAHRVSYFLSNGHNPSPEEFICHKCDNPLCVNPQHLFIGDAKTNTQDMVLKGRQANLRKTHCLRGHEFTPENIVYNKLRRSCRICKNAKRKARREATPSLSQNEGSHEDIPKSDD